MLLASLGAPPVPAAPPPPSSISQQYIPAVYPSSVARHCIPGSWHCAPPPTTKYERKAVYDDQDHNCGTHGTGGDACRIHGRQAAIALLRPSCCALSLPAALPRTLRLLLLRSLHLCLLPERL